MDKLVDITIRGTTQVNELGFQCDDQRGRQDDKIITELFPQSAGGGGQALANKVVNRYRPGNKYRYVRANGTITQFNAVIRDVTFATVAQRAYNVINSSAVSQCIAGVWEQGASGPLTTDPALGTDAAGVFAFITTHGLAIVNVNAAVVANDKLGSSAVAGQLVTIDAGAMYAQAEARAAIAAAAGLGALAMSDEPPAGFKANLTWVHLE